MTPNEQNCAIAKVCGWTHFTPDTVQYTARRNDGKWGVIPEYTADLNAMHEAVAHLEPDEVDQFAIELSAIVLENDLKAWWDLNPNEIAYVANADAAQRAEAFLRTLNLWKDEA